MINIFAFIMTVLWAGVFVMIISFLRERMLNIKCFSIHSLLILLIFCIFRVILPLELPFTIVINSDKFLPVVQSFFSTIIINFSYIKINLIQILALIWVIGIIAISFKHIRIIYYFRRMLNSAKPIENQHIYDIFNEANMCSGLRNVKIISSNCFSSPGITGFFKPIIILPDIDFSDDELFGIFTHEVAHYKYKHFLITHITEYIRVVFWWNPMLKRLPAETEHVLELYADKTVSSRLDYEQRLSYLAAIIKVTENSKNSVPTRTAYSGLTKGNDRNKLVQRFKLFTEDRYQFNKRHIFITILITLAVFILSYSFIFQPYSYPTLTDFGDNTNWNDESFFMIKTENGYDIYVYPDLPVTHVDKIYDEIKDIKIYNRMEDVERR